MGLTGSFVSVAGSIDRYQNIVLVLTGTVMVLAGLGLAGWLPLCKRISLFTRAALFVSSGVSRIAHVIAREQTAGVYFPLGMILGFLPCGILYTAFIAAAGAGAAAPGRVEGLIGGFIMLFLFGLGTVPALFLVGKIVVSQRERISGYLHRASAVSLIAVGGLFLFRALSP